VNILKQYIFVLTGDMVWKQAPGSFIFSLRNKENIPPFKAPLKHQNDLQALKAYPNGGPMFGKGYDIRIRDNAASQADSYTYFDNSYKPSSGVSDPNTILSGTYKFTPSEIEVFYLV
jgi:hypothetical protein